MLQRPQLFDKHQFVRITFVQNYYSAKQFVVSGYLVREPWFQLLHTTEAAQTVENFPYTNS